MNNAYHSIDPRLLAWVSKDWSLQDRRIREHPMRSWQGQQERVQVWPAQVESPATLLLPTSPLGGTATPEIKVHLVYSLWLPPRIWLVDFASLNIFRKEALSLESVLIRSRCHYFKAQLSCLVSWLKVILNTKASCTKLLVLCVSLLHWTETLNGLCCVLCVFLRMSKPRNTEP